MKKAAFIGTGNMGVPLIQSACMAIGPEEVVITNRTGAKALFLAEQLGCACGEDNEAAVREAEYIFLCVKPQLLKSVADELTSVLKDCFEQGEEKVLVSIAAGVQIGTLQSYFSDAGYPVPILRLMPNTCAAVGQGMLALAHAPDVPGGRLSAVEEILSRAGRVERLPESLMDAFAAVAGCGPAFVYQFIEALADGGVMAGLPRNQAQIYAAQTVLGAAAMVLESGAHPGELKDAVCSPGGSTIMGVAALERGGFRAAAIEAVSAAYWKNMELGKKAD